MGENVDIAKVRVKDSGIRTIEYTLRNLQNNNEVPYFFNETVMNAI